MEGGREGEVTDKKVKYVNDEDLEEVRFILGSPNVASSKEGNLRSVKSDDPKLT